MKISSFFVAFLENTIFNLNFTGLVQTMTPKGHFEINWPLWRPQKLKKSSPSIWHLLHNVKSTGKIWSIFVAFLENMNFNSSLIFRIIWYLVLTHLKAIQQQLGTYWKTLDLNWLLFLYPWWCLFFWCIYWFVNLTPGLPSNTHWGKRNKVF